MEVLRAVADVGPVAELVGRLLFDAAVEAVAVLVGLLRSRSVDEVGGLLGVVVGLLAGTLPLMGGFVVVVERVFSGDFGPSADEGLEDGVGTRSAVSPEVSISMML